MKEDIEIKSLKSASELIKKNYTFGKSAMRDLARDIDKILYKIEQLEEENKRLNNHNIIGRIDAIKIEDLEPVLKPYYIPKSKVKEKIEEYNKVIETTEEQLKHEENVDVRRRLTTTIEQATAGILALEELLREE